VTAWRGGNYGAKSEKYLALGLFLSFSSGLCVRVAIIHFALLYVYVVLFQLSRARYLSDEESEKRLSDTGEQPFS
jgi:hypothetical protein